MNLPLKHFRATIANAGKLSLKSLNKFRKKYLYHMLVEFELNRLVQTTRNFELLTKKQVFITIFDRVDAILEDVSVAEIDV